MVLTIVANLRKKGVVGKFVEFYGPGVADLSVADRATIANMAPEYGATMGFFPVDGKVVLFFSQPSFPKSSLCVVVALGIQWVTADGLDDCLSPPDRPQR